LAVFLFEAAGNAQKLESRALRGAREKGRKSQGRRYRHLPGQHGTGLRYGQETERENETMRRRQTYSAMAEAMERAEREAKPPPPAKKKRRGRPPKRKQPA